MNKKIIGILSVALLITVSTILYGVSFGNPFGVMNPDRKMTKSELIKATRLMAAAEFEAVQNYMQVAESTDDALAKKVYTDIANEERVHAGEFLRLLNYLDPQENTFYQKGATEVEDEMKKLEQKTEPKNINQPTAPANTQTAKIGNVNVLVETESVAVKETAQDITKDIQKPAEDTADKPSIEPIKQTGEESKTEPIKLDITEVDEIYEGPATIRENIEKIEPKKTEPVKINFSEPIKQDLSELKKQEPSNPVLNESSKPNVDIIKEEVITEPVEPIIEISEPAKQAITETKSMETKKKQYLPETTIQPQIDNKSTEINLINESEAKKETQKEQLDIKKLITEKLNEVTKKASTNKPTEKEIAK